MKEVGIKMKRMKWKKRPRMKINTNEKQSRKKERNQSSHPLKMEVDMKGRDYCVDKEPCLFCMEFYNSE